MVAAARPARPKTPIAPAAEEALNEYIYFQESEFDKDFEAKLRGFDLEEIERELNRREQLKEQDPKQPPGNIEKQDDGSVEK